MVTVVINGAPPALSRLERRHCVGRPVSERDIARAIASEIGERSKDTSYGGESRVGAAVRLASSASTLLCVATASPGLCCRTRT